MNDRRTHRTALLVCDRRKNKDWEQGRVSRNSQSTTHSQVVPVVSVFVYSSRKPHVSSVHCDSDVTVQPKRCRVDRILSRLSTGGYVVSNSSLKFDFTLIYSFSFILQSLTCDVTFRFTNFVFPQSNHNQLQTPRFFLLI